MALVPDDAGAEKATEAVAFPGVIVPITGGPGETPGITVTSADGTLLPAEFVARTLQAYCEPFVRPVTVMGLAEPVAVPVGEPTTAQVAV